MPNVLTTTRISLTSSVNVSSPIGTKITHKNYIKKVECYSR